MSGLSLPNIDKHHDLMRLIGQHFGSGEIYLTGRQDKALLQAAKEYGLVSREGYLTQSGHSVWTDFLVHGRAPPLPSALSNRQANMSFTAHREAVR